MATVISVLNPKGGVGKSTVSIHVATGLLRWGASTCLIDTDPQGSAAEWDSLRTEAGEKQSGEFPPVHTVDARSDPDDIRTMVIREDPNDVIVIDGSAKTDRPLGVTLRQSDVVLVPVPPAFIDMRAAAGFMDLVRSVQSGYKTPSGIPIARGVTTRVRHGTREENEVAEGFEALDLPEITEAGGDSPVRLYQRVAYPRSIADGLTVFDGWLDPDESFSRDPKARAEAENLTSALAGILQKANLLPA